MTERVRYSWPWNLLHRMAPQPNGCIWLNLQPNDQGYHQIYVKGRNTKAHIAAYRMFVGPIPPGMTIDHECHNQDESCIGGSTCGHRRCINPAHLVLRSSGENSRSSRNTVVSINKAKTHCIRGHEFSEANTYRPGRGGRQCRACATERMRRYR